MTAHAFKPPPRSQERWFLLCIALRSGILVYMIWDSMFDSRFSWQKIPHYYGDVVRVLFVVVAVLLLISIPMFGTVLPFGVPAQIVGAIILVLCAAFTNPHSKWIVVANAIIAGCAVMLFEAAGIFLYTKDAIPLFFVREAGALLMLFALYFSVKTARSFIMHTIGHTSNSFGEFPDKE